jgi:hypothetical protein
MSTKRKITYGFKLDFPAKFTMHQLCRLRHDMKYITAHKRVEKALATGELVVVGREEPEVTRKGARRLIYQRVDAKAATVKA